MKKINVIDLHTDYVLTLYDKGRSLQTTRQISYKKIKNGNVKLFFGGFSYDDLLGDSQKQLNVMLTKIKKLKDLILIRNSLDIKNLFNSKNNNTGTIIHLEGSKIITQYGLKNLFESGVRSLSLTHSKGNFLAGGNNITFTQGITNKGKEVIKLALQLGMWIDIAHLNETSFKQALDLMGDKPPIVTHTGIYNFCPDPRNLKDWQLKEISKRKGLIGIFFAPKHIICKRSMSINQLIDIFKYTADLVGIDSVAIGSDFGGMPSGVPEGLEDISKTNLLLKLLLKNGFKLDDVEKIAYKNAYRVLTSW